MMHGQGRFGSKQLKIALAIGIVALFFVLGYVCVRAVTAKKMVMHVQIPDSPYTLELWEKPDLIVFPVMYLYETWFVLHTGRERKWYLIDAQYITFTYVTILYSASDKQVRVEVEGSTDTHMIAKYDVDQDVFRAVDETSVRNQSGWIVLTSARIHYR